MEKYHLEYSKNAEMDIDSLFNVIIYDYNAPITAFRYIEGLIDTINELSVTGALYSNYTAISITEYGQNLKRINYKKMAILYSIYKDIVYIHRIIPANTIVGLLKES